MFRLVTLAVVALLLVACSGESEGEADRDLDESIALVEMVPEVMKVVRVTEDNDPHDLAGRSEGVLAVAVVYDSRLECQSLSIECGAIIEKWSDRGEAKSRSESVKAHQQGMPMLGTEYHFLEGDTLLRVEGKLGKDQAAEYEKAFTG